jgi:histone-lysine N-methyltransferase SETD1
MRRALALTRVRPSPHRLALVPPKQPNSYCKVVTVEQLKRIAIFAKRDLAPNEEITYDYKFATEKDKIDCYCGAARCIGRMN